MLRRKMEDMEGENDRLSTEVLELQQLAKASATATEMDKLKKQLVDKNSEIRTLNEALAQAERSKSKVVVQRSRSLEGESTLDLRVRSSISISLAYFWMTVMTRTTSSR